MIENIDTLPLSLKKMLPNFEFKAYDYSPRGKEPIKGTALIQAILWMLKAIREKNKKAFKKGYNKFLEQLQIIAETYDMETAIEIYFISLVYIFNTREDMTQEELQEALPEGGKTMETLAKRIYNKGREEEKEKVLINFYNKGIPVETIAQGLEITKERALEIIEQAKKQRKIKD